MKKIYRMLLVMIATSIVLVGCSNKKLKIAYTVYPIKFLLEEIGGDKVEIFSFSDETMVLRSQLAEDYRDILKKVDALFIMGELEPYMDIATLKEGAARTSMNLAMNNPRFAGAKTTSILNKVSKVRDNPDVEYQREAIKKFLNENETEPATHR